MAKSSNSKNARFKRCLRKYYYADVLKLKQKTQSIAPVRGTLIHSCVESLYKGDDWAKPIEESMTKLDTTEDIFDEERAEWATLFDDCYRIMRGYVRAFAEADKAWTVLATEVQFEMPMGEHTYCGTIDLIVQDARGIWIVDHKTTKVIPPVEELYMDMQTMMYLKAVREGHVKLPAGVDRNKIAGVIFNHVRTKAPRVPATLKNGSISKAACDTDVATYFEAVKRAGLDPEDYKDMLEKLEGNVFYRRARIPVSEAVLNNIGLDTYHTMQIMNGYNERIKGKDVHDVAPLFTRNLLKQRCTWDCEFCKLCFADMMGQNTEELINLEYTERDERYDDEETED